MTAGALLLAATTAPGGAGQPDLLDPKGPASHGIAVVWWILFGLALFVFVAVVGLAVVGVVRGRDARPADEGGTEDLSLRNVARPLGTSDDRFIATGGVAIPLVILLATGVVTIVATRQIWGSPHADVHLRVEAVQWYWAVHEPDGITTANEIVVPVGQSVEIALTSRDVIHSFWVPQLAAKVDVIPGQTNVVRFTASVAGTFRGMCAEFCGIQHANMNFFVEAKTPAAYRAWLAQHRRPPAQPTTALTRAGRADFEADSCAGCHTVAGTTARGTAGPDLTDLGSRSTLGAGVVTNDPANLAAWIRDPGAVKPGVHMPPSELPAGQVDAIVAYLEAQR